MNALPSCEICRQCGIGTGETGMTTIRFTIAADGSVKDASADRSNGHYDLDDAALRCVGQWHYQPMFRNGIAVEKPR